MVPRHSIALTVPAHGGLQTQSAASAARSMTNISHGPVSITPMQPQEAVPFQAKYKAIAAKAAKRRDAAACSNTGSFPRRSQAAHGSDSASSALPLSLLVPALIV